MPPPAPSIASDMTAAINSWLASLTAGATAAFPAGGVYKTQFPVEIPKLLHVTTDNPAGAPVVFRRYVQANYTSTSWTWVQTQTGVNPQGVPQYSYTTTVTVAGAGWTTNQWVNSLLVTRSGPAVNKMRAITSNTATTITITSGLDVQPAAGDTFDLIDNSDFVGAGGKVGQGQRNNYHVSITEAANGSEIDHIRVEGHGGRFFTSIMEAGHAFSFSGAQSCHIHHCSGDGVWGDGISCNPGTLEQTITAAPTLPGWVGTLEADHNDFTNIGRQGLTSTGLKDSNVHHNTWNVVRRSGIDIEPPSDDRGGCVRTTFEANTFTAVGNALLANGNLHGRVEDLLFKDNIGDTFSIGFGSSSAEYPRVRIYFEGNIGLVAQPRVSILNVDDLRWINNQVIWQNRNDQLGVEAINCSNATFRASTLDDMQILPAWPNRPGPISADIGSVFAPQPYGTKWNKLFPGQVPVNCGVYLATGNSLVSALGGSFTIVPTNVGVLPTVVAEAGSTIQGYGTFAVRTELYGTVTVQPPSQFGVQRAGSGFLGAGATAQMTAALGVAPVAGDLLFVTARASAPTTLTPFSGWTLHYTADPGPNAGFYLSKRCTGSEGTGAQQFGTTDILTPLRVAWQLIGGPFATSMLDISKMVSTGGVAFNVATLTADSPMSIAPEVAIYGNCATSSRTTAIVFDSAWNTPINADSGRVIQAHRLLSSIQTPTYDWSWSGGQGRAYNHAIFTFKGMGAAAQALGLTGKALAIVSQLAGIKGLNTIAPPSFTIEAEIDSGFETIYGRPDSRLLIPAPTTTTLEGVPSTIGLVAYPTPIDYGLLDVVPGARAIAVAGHATPVAYGLLLTGFGLPSTQDVNAAGRQVDMVPGGPALVAGAIGVALSGHVVPVVIGLPSDVPYQAVGLTGKLLVAGMGSPLVLTGPLTIALTSWNLVVITSDGASVLGGRRQDRRRGAIIVHPQRVLTYPAAVTPSYITVPTRRD